MNQKIIKWFEEDKNFKMATIGQIVVIIGFALYGITSTYYMKPPFDYYSKPNIWFIISIILMVYGFYLWIKWIIREFHNTTDTTCPSHNCG